MGPVLDLLRQIMDIYDGGIDSRLTKPVEAIVDERATSDLDQRLGTGQCQRPHALAIACGENHRLSADAAH